jgi:diguanylate cyclase (GGDEF)-like protein
MELGAFTDFREAAQAAMEFLHRRIGFDLWLVTRIEGEQWIILQADDHGGYGVQPGHVFRWADTFCYEMVRGNGPHIAPRADFVQIYADAPIGQNFKIGAYLGFPLTRDDGTVFGTLCALHPAAQPQTILSEQPLVSLISRLLGTILSSELRTLDGRRREERLAAQRWIDPVTDLYDREGWGILLAAEEERCRRYGDPACVILCDTRASFDESMSHGGREETDNLMRIAAACATRIVREGDVVARVGDSKIAVLAVACDRAGARALLSRLNESLAGERIHASIGVAHRAPPLITLAHAWTAADQAAAAAREPSP